MTEILKIIAPSTNSAAAAAAEITGDGAEAGFLASAALHGDAAGQSASGTDHVLDALETWLSAQSGVTADLAEGDTAPVEEAADDVLVSDLPAETGFPPRGAGAAAVVSVTEKEAEISVNLTVLNKLATQIDAGSKSVDAPLAPVSWLHPEPPQARDDRTPEEETLLSPADKTGGQEENERSVAAGPGASKFRAQRDQSNGSEGSAAPAGSSINLYSLRGSASLETSDIWDSGSKGSVGPRPGAVSLPAIAHITAGSSAHDTAPAQGAALGASQFGSQLLGLDGIGVPESALPTSQQPTSSVPLPTHKSAAGTRGKDIAPAQDIEIPVSGTTRDLSDGAIAATSQGGSRGDDSNEVTEMPLSGARKAMNAPAAPARAAIEGVRLHGSGVTETGVMQLAGSKASVQAYSGEVSTDVKAVNLPQPVTPSQRPATDTLVEVRTSVQGAGTEQPGARFASTSSEKIGDARSTLLASAPLPDREAPRAERDHGATASRDTSIVATYLTKPPAVAASNMPVGLFEPAPAAPGVEGADTSSFLVAMPDAEAPARPAATAAELRAASPVQHGHPPSRQIADALVISRGETTEILLSPDELGRVRMVMGGPDRAQLVIWAERTDTLDLLRRNADSLGADLAAAGFGSASMEFREGGAWQAPQEADIGDHAEASPAMLQPRAMAHRFIDPQRRIDIRV